MSPRAALFTCLLAATAQARAFTVVAPAGIRLKSAEPTTCEDGDVCLEHNRVEARFGVRIESHQADFASVAPLVLDEPYSIRDLLGTEYRVWIHDAVDGRIAVEVLTAQVPAPAEDPTGIAGRYKVTSVRIGGEDTDSRYPDLRLEADGVFHMGSTTGAWSTDRRSVSLSGHFSTWGPAEVANDGSLVFRFRRGELDFEIKMAPQTGSVAARSSDSRTPGS